MYPTDDHVAAAELVLQVDRVLLHVARAAQFWSTKSMTPPAPVARPSELPCGGVMPAGNGFDSVSAGVRPPSTLDRNVVDAGVAASSRSPLRRGPAYWSAPRRSRSRREATVLSVERPGEAAARRDAVERLALRASGSRRRRHTSARP